VLLPCIDTSESHASAVAVLTQVLSELARVTSHYSPQQKYTLRGRRGTSTESCNSMAYCLLDSLDRITYFFRLARAQRTPCTSSDPKMKRASVLMKCLTKKTRQRRQTQSGGLCAAWGQASKTDRCRSVSLAYLCLESVRKRPVVRGEIQRSGY
jgi:hypothetical protein